MDSSIDAHIDIDLSILGLLSFRIPREENERQRTSDTASRQPASVRGLDWMFVARDLEPGPLIMQSFWSSVSLITEQSGLLAALMRAGG